jgi:hypothetical protein
LHASPLQFTSVRSEDSVIILDGFQPDGFDAQARLKPFPIRPGAVDRSVFEAILVFMGCMESMMYLYSFAKEFLAG